MNFSFCKKYESTKGLLPLLLCMNQTKIFAVLFRVNTIDSVCKKSNSPLLCKDCLTSTIF